MLYIASALTPTPVSHTVKADDFTSAGTSSLIIAKPDRVEVWDVGETGLTSRGELVTWGTVAGLATVNVADTRTHVLVLVGPPNARLLLIAWEDGEIVVTASQALAPPTPALRRQEFFTGVIAQDNLALVSVWTGLLACVEMEAEKVKGASKRRASEVKNVDDRRLVFKTTFNINIREHNLLDLAFGPPRPNESPMVTFLWMSEYNKIQLQPRQFSAAKHQFDERAPITDVVNPTEYPVEQADDVDFNDIPFSCPAGRNVLAIPGSGPGGVGLFLVIGDEHAVLYAVSAAPNSPKKPSVASARASAARRSPQAETGGVGKKRKSSMSGRSVNADVENKWHVQPVWRVRQGWGTVLATTVLETHASGGSVVLGDERGRLTAIGWEFDSGDTVRVGKVDIGIASPPTALTYIDNGVMFVSSACGDSLLISLNLPETSPSVSAATTAPRSIKGKGRAHESTDGGAWTIILDDDVQADQSVKERWMNLAPMKDMAVVEEDDGRMSHLVVASGSANTNSLRIVRSGVGLESVVTVEGVAGIERMWAVGKTLIISFANSTALFNLEPEIAQGKVPSEFSDEPTLAVGTVANGLAQIVPSGVLVWQTAGKGRVTASSEILWEHAAEEGNEVVAGAIKSNCIVIATRDGSIHVFNSGSHGIENIEVGKLPREVAAIAVCFERKEDDSGADIKDNDSDLGSEDEMDPGMDGGAIALIAVAYWTGEISLYHVDSFGSGEAEPEPLGTIHERVYASSLMFYDDSGHNPRLVAGLSDGTLVSVDADSTSYNFTNGRQVSSLGSRPLLVTPLKLQSDKFEERVVAAGISDRLSVVFESRGHLEFSASGKKNVVAAVALSTPSLGSCIALATPEGLSFERLTSLKKLQVVTLDTADSSATRLAYVPHQNLLAVGSVTRTLDAETGDIFQASSLDLRHPTTLDFLGDYQLPEREAVASVTTVFLNGKHYIALGTAIFSSPDALDESNIDEVHSFVSVEQGRLFLMEATDRNGTWSLDFVETVDTNGAVFDVTVIHGFLVIASSMKATVLRLMNGRLEETASFTFSFEAHYLDVLKDNERELLVLGDAMRSIIVLEVDEESGEIRSDQRDMAPHSVRALGTVRDGAQDVILTDEHANILTYRVGEELVPAASFGMHEDVARFRSGALVATYPDELRPDLLFATSNGRLGIIGELGKSATRTLSDLQRNMNKYMKGPGNLDWRAFRRGGSSLVPKETAGFIDGDFVQMFLDADDADAQRILNGATQPERVAKLVGETKKDASDEDVVRVLEAAGGLH